MNIIPYGKQTILEEDIQSVVEVLKSDYLTTGPKIKDRITSYNVCYTKLLRYLIN